MQPKLAARDMISYFNRWDQQVINQIGWRTSYHKSRAEPNLPRQPFAQIYHELTGNPHRNRRGNPCLRRGQRGPRSIAEGGGLLVAVLEGGGRRLVAGEVGDEGVEAVDRHFLRGHHHTADRRWSLPRRATSSSARAGGNGGGGDRLGNRAVRGEEEVGRRKQAMRLFLLSPWRGLLPLRVFPFFVWTILPPGMWLSTSSVLAVLVLLLEMKFARVRLQLQL